MPGPRRTNDVKTRADSLAPDVAEFVELCQAGQFYDHLMELGGIAVADRAAFRTNFFGRVCFCENDPIKPEAELFGRSFPTVYGAVRAWKADDFRALSHDLQRFESGLMIGRVARRIMGELPGVFFATIHDSVLTTAAYAEAMRRIMVEEFVSAGLRPTINVEDCRTTDLSRRPRSRPKRRRGKERRPGRRRRTAVRTAAAAV